MAQTKKTKDSCCSTSDSVACCRVDSVVSVDERGQMVLPKDIRDKAGIKAGDKLALVAWEKNGKVCCLSFIKVGELSGMVRGTLGPLAQEIFGEK